MTVTIKQFPITASLPIFPVRREGAFKMDFAVISMKLPV